MWPGMCVYSKSMVGHEGNTPLCQYVRVSAMIWASDTCAFVL